MFYHSLNSIADQVDPGSSNQSSQQKTKRTTNSSLPSTKNVHIDISEQRLSNELKKIKNSTVLQDEFGASLFYDEKYIHKWFIDMNGPVGSPYESGDFKLELTFGRKYPYESPIVKFRSPIFHVNVSSDGVLSPELIQTDWNPGSGVIAILRQIKSLLYVSNTAEEFICNRIAFDILQKSEEDFLQYINVYIKEHSKGWLIT